MTEQLTKSIQKLDAWIEQNGWAGYDPYDLKGTRFFLALRKINLYPVADVIGLIVHTIESYLPAFLRKVFRIRKKINAKGMGLFAEGYLNLYRATNTQRYLDKSIECLDWLEHNNSKGYHGYCWGYPFDWQSRIFIPKRTPSAVVSVTVGNAFWQFYKFSNNQKYLEICKSICEFLTNDLNIDSISGEQICFSYTPLDNFHVHNANLFTAEFLIKIGSEINNTSYITLGKKALAYSLTQQNSDGSFYYWGRPDKLLHNIDHYHTGFVLRSLYSIHEITKDERVFASLSKGIKFYTNNLFYKESIPRLSTKRIYPIDIHSCSEAILSLSMLNKEFSGLDTLLNHTLRWVLENMQDDKGYFYYQKLSHRTIKIPFIRWSEAWMLNALSYRLTLLSK